MSGRCTGHCCAGFSMGGAPEELFAMPGFNDHEDAEFVKDMLVYLGKFETNPGGRTTERKTEVGSGFKGHFYTCRHYDGKDCTVYDTRPQMCRYYPNGSRCIFVDCTCVMSLEVLIEEAWKMREGKRNFLRMPEWTQKLIYGRTKWIPILANESLKDLEEIDDPVFLEALETAVKFPPAPLTPNEEMMIAEDKRFLEYVEKAVQSGRED